MGKDRLIDGALKGYPVAWFSPTYKMLKPVWREVKALLAPITSYRDEQEKYIELITGGSIEFWSLENPDAPRGRKYWLIVWDEAAMHKDPDTWPSVIRPLLTDYRGGAWFLTTPRGQNFLYDLFGLGLDPLVPDWAAWTFPTSSNPYIHPEEIAEAQALLPQRWFEQEFLAIFLEDGTGVFRGVDKVCTAQPLERPIPGHRYGFGVDWGKANDFTVISIMDLTTNTQVALDRFNQISWEYQKERLMKLAELWRPVKVLAEENSIGGPMIDSLAKETLQVVTYRDPEYDNEPLEDRGSLITKRLPIKGFSTTGETKGPLIESYALSIEKGEVTLLKDPTQIKELKSYELERLPSGRYRYSAPAGKHDDIVIAGALSDQLRQHRAVMSSKANPFYG